MNKLSNNTLSPNTWVDNYADYLFNFAKARVNDTDIANDLVQETFFSALKAAHNFKGKSTEKTWLTAILKRKVVDYYRKINSKKGQAEIKVNFHEQGNEKGNWIEEHAPQSWDTSIESTIENRELKNQLDDCINRLPEKYAIVFRMKTIQGLSTDVICNDLEITPSNLWVMIHRARTQLRACMEKNWFKK